jgi:NADH-quinone oxidoreductase subunit E
MVRTTMMSVFGKSDQREGATGFEWMTGETAFDMPAEMAAAMRLMADPVTGAVAMSALGFGMAAHAVGLWAGSMAGALQLSQRLLTLSASGQAATASSQPVPSPKREKPALTVVATNEVPAPADLAATAVAPTVERGAAPAPAQPVPSASPVELVTAEAAPQSAVRKPGAVERPAAPDDLKAISGIGPKLEKVLNDLGIWTYAQIAAWDKTEVAWMDDRLGFKGRIDRDGWIAQARALAK